MTRSMSESQWPTHPKFLIPGVNDTWNDYQKFRKGTVVTSKDWKDARQALNAEFQQFLSEGGLLAQIEKVAHRFECMVNFKLCFPILPHSLPSIF
jgi:hypothetical protein